ncbi:hypothetical protein EG329_002634 [Mollisiaceae sp. DMI_Dod_QoI]|nr:hypothetical protein EG329_002634 [Helotiales sp. DMI_Dod_QoI]
MHSLNVLVRGLLASLAFSSTALGAGLKQITNWGDNPSQISAMYMYVPDKVAAKPAVILALHPCGGTAQIYYQMTKLPSYADKLGFILIYPTTTHETNCWDCHSNKTLTHNGGGDSQGLVAMVNYALKTYNGDPTKVFAVGGSSGAMMTNVLAATYPDVFNAGASWSGVPAGCWYGSPISTPMSSDLSCPMARKTYTAQQWGDIARGCYPGYNGTRTRMVVTHGTADTAVLYPLFKQQLDQWSNVLGVEWTKNLTGTPQTGWTEEVFGDGTQLLGLSVQGGGHIPPFQEELVLKFFGLM